MFDEVVLLDESACPIGVADRTRVHTRYTPYHLAFSCYLFDDQGRVLLTRRSLSKVAWPGVWTNSACGHPRAGEDQRVAVVRRVTSELGVVPERLSLALPAFSYRAVDPGGIVENEFCPVWLGHLPDARVNPDPDEVMDSCWVTWETLTAMVEGAPALLSPWSVLQVPQLDRVLAAELSAT